MGVKGTGTHGVEIRTGKGKKKEGSERSIAPSKNSGYGLDCCTTSRKTFNTKPL